MVLFGVVGDVTDDRWSENKLYSESFGLRGGGRRPDISSMDETETLSPFDNFEWPAGGWESCLCWYSGRMCRYFSPYR